MPGTVRSLVAAVAVTLTVLLGMQTGAGAASTGVPVPPPSTPVLAIGPVTVDFATVDRWGSAFATPSEQQRRLRLTYARCHRPVVEPTRRRGCERLLAGAWTGAAWTLVHGHTALLEADRLGVPVTAVPLSSGLRRAIVTTRTTRADRRLWLRMAYAAKAVERAAVAALPPLTDGDLTRAWLRQTEPSWFTRRQVRAEVVQLRTRGDADAAFAAVAAGESFASVGARLSPPGRSVYRGEPQLFSDPYHDDPDLRGPLLAAVVGAAPGALLGPISADGVHYVARVTEVVTERARIPLAQVQARLRDDLTLRRETKAVASAWAAAERRWRGRTRCVRQFARVQPCGRVVASL